MPFAPWMSALRNRSGSCGAPARKRYMRIRATLSYASAWDIARTFVEMLVAHGSPVQCNSRAFDAEELTAPNSPDSGWC